MSDIVSLLSSESKTKGVKPGSKEFFTALNGILNEFNFLLEMRTKNNPNTIMFVSL